jgi:hypothetical protein
MPCSTWSAEAIVEASTIAGIASNVARPKKGERNSQASAAKPKTRPIRTRVLSLRAKCAAFSRVLVVASCAGASRAAREVRIGFRPRSSERTVGATSAIETRPGMCVELDRRRP